MYELKPLRDLLNLGYFLADLRMARFKTCGHLVDEVDQVQTLLKSLDLHTTNAAANSVARRIAKLDNPRIKDIMAGDTWGPPIEADMAVVLEALGTEIKEKKLLVVEPNAISDHLRDLATKTARMTDIQKGLFNDMIRCVETESFRAAYVMGWAFAYDVIRWWMWDNVTRQIAFRDALASRNRPVPTEYGDFFHLTLSEWDVLQAFFDAGLLKPSAGKLHDRLKECLRERNDHAHANDVEPNRDSASAYIYKLSQIVRGKPFECLQ